MVRPGFRALEFGHLAALLVALLAAATIILMRSLAGEKQTTMLGVLVSYCLVFNGLAAAVTSSLMLPGLGLAGYACGGRGVHCLRSPVATARHAPQPGQRDRADALFPDHLGGSHRRDILLRISGLDQA